MILRFLGNRFQTRILDPHRKINPYRPSTISGNKIQKIVGDVKVPIKFYDDAS